MSDQNPNPQEKAPVPPATFEYLAATLRFQAELSLGLFQLEEDVKEGKTDLDGARHYIDLLDMLREKTKGNLTLEEQRFVDNSLTELRFRYIQKAAPSAKA